MTGSLTAAVKLRRCGRLRNSGDVAAVASTNKNDAPGASDAATISRWSASGHDLYRAA